MELFDCSDCSDCLIEPGCDILGWKVVRFLGMGQSGEVYEVLREGQRGALKICRGRQVTVSREEFAREIATMKEQPAPGHMPRFFAEGKWAGDYWVVVETRGGNPDGTIREDDKPVKYLKVAPPAKKTLTVHPTAAAALEGNDPLTEIDRSAGYLYLRAEGHTFAEGETLTATLDSPGLDAPESHELEIAMIDGAPAVTNPFDTPLHAGLTGLITMENADVLGELAFVPEE